MKTKWLLILVTAIIVAVFSCQKNEFLKHEDETSLTKGVPPAGLDLSGISLYYGMLRFPSFAKFNYIIDGLDDECDDYWEDILNQYGDMSDDEFNNLLDSLGIEEIQPLLDFEKHFKFYSLRKYIYEEELKWLEYEYPDCCLDPDDHFILDETLRTTLNVDGEVIIDSTIYKIYDNGTTVLIDDLDLNLLKTVRKIDEEFIDTLRHPLFTVYYKAGQASSDSCRDFKKEKEFKESGKRKIKATLSIVTWPWAGKIKAKTKNYKKKKKGWKVYRTNASVRIEGKVYDGECSNQQDIDVFKTDKKKKVKQKIKFNNNAVKTKSGELKSHHYGADGITLTLTLQGW